MRQSGDRHPRAEEMLDPERARLDDASRDRSLLVGAAAAACLCVMLAVAAILAAVALPSANPARPQASGPPQAQMFPHAPR